MKRLSTITDFTLETKQTPPEPDASSVSIPDASNTIQTDGHYVAKPKIDVAKFKGGTFYGFSSWFQQFENVLPTLNGYG